MTFNPKDYLMDMRGKQYLEVKWRIVWFRDEHPSGAITTELASVDPVVMKATISDAEGHILATGFGTPKMQGVAKARPFEGAETAAIGRALALAGYGTQFTGEDEGEHLADSPVGTPQTAVLQYQDGSSVQVGNSAKARAEQNSFVEYCKAHDGNAPKNIHNLRAWKEQQAKEKEQE